jgi:hypothetical protein
MLLVSSLLLGQWKGLISLLSSKLCYDCGVSCAMTASIPCAEFPLA